MRRGFALPLLLREDRHPVDVKERLPHRPTQVDVIVSVVPNALMQRVSLVQLCLDRLVPPRLCRSALEAQPRDVRVFRRQIQVEEFQLCGRRAVVDTSGHDLVEAPAVYRDEQRPGVQHDRRSLADPQRDDGGGPGLGLGRRRQRKADGLPLDAPPEHLGLHEDMVLDHHAMLLHRDEESLN